LEQIPDELPRDEPQEPDELTRLLYRALEMICGDFESRTWQIFQRTAIEGRDAADVARELGMTARAVRQAKHRVVKRLREEYAGLLEVRESDFRQ
jgi:RNA polymerase sigma-70 factor (ECF subfamily)